VLCGADFIFQSHWLEKFVPESLRKYVHIIPKSGKEGPTEREMSAHMFVIARGKELRSREFLNGLNRMSCQPYRASIAVSVEKERELRETIDPGRLNFFALSDIYYQHRIDMDMVHAQALAIPSESGVRMQS
jgi:hypothetical protein